MNLKLISALFGCLVLTACSNKDMYNAIQDNQKRECNKVANDGERAECLKGLGMPHRDYERERTRED